MREPPAPRGWKKLHKMAQDERDPNRLALLVERMNRLLGEQEKKTAKKEADGEE